MEVPYSVWGRHGQVDTEWAEIDEKPDSRGWYHGHTRIGYKVAVVLQNHMWHLVWKEDMWEFQARKEQENDAKL